MGQDPGQIRQEIEQTRAQMSDTLEAVGHKADVKERAKDAVAEKVDAAKGKVTDRASQAESKVKHRAAQLSSAAQENPLGLALGGVAAGFLAGLVVPATRTEQEKLAAAGEELREQARKTGHDALERGRHVAREAAHSAAETAKEQGRQQGHELADHAKQSGREVSSRLPS